MNYANSMSLRSRINNFAKKEGVSPQLALQSFFVERFLARIERSRYSRNLVVKGGTLMCAIFGLRQRTTMDIDASVVGFHVDAESIVQIVDEIATIDMEDGIRFRLDRSSMTTITKDDEYGGYSICLIAEFGTIRLPLSIDVTYGDAITPSPQFRDFTGVIDNQVHIRLLSYTVETVMAEKIQSILKRGVATTRPRDFYDLHMLHARGGYCANILSLALRNTIENRDSQKYLDEWRSIVASISDSDFQRRQWNAYQRKMPYARGIAFSVLIDSLESILLCAAR